MKDIQAKISDFTVEIKGNNELNNYISTQKEYIPSNINLISAPILWNQGYTGKNIKIAVIDTGCCTTHPDLKDNIIGGRNFTSEDNGDPNKYEDGNSHGTHCCGVIAGNGHILGVAPNAKLLVLKALGSSGNGNLESIVNAMNYAIDQKVDIISMSLGCTMDVSELQQAVKRAVANNILIVAACGNGGDGNDNTLERDYPSSYEETVAIGAIDNMRKFAVFSNTNNYVDLVAPGVKIVSTGLNNGYITLSGTSMACPHVAGACALLLEKFIKEYGRRPSESELYAQLIKNTIDLGIDRRIQGNGMLFLE